MVNSRSQAFARCVVTVVLPLIAFVAHASAQNPSHRLLSPAIAPSSGYLFVDGRYIAPPIVISVDSDALQINGIPVKSDAISDSFLMRPSARNTGKLPTERSLAKRLNRFAGDVVVSLGSKEVVILGSDRPAFSVPMQDGGVELLQRLIRQTEAPIIQDQRLHDTLRDQEVDLGYFQSWVDQFRAPRDLVDRARVETADVTAKILQNETISTSFRWREKLAYPLTVIGMVLVVLSFGHLLTERPRSAGLETPDGFSIQHETAIRRSLIYVSALSMMDLVWTILASQAGTMRELNPLGSHLVSDPLALFVIKLGVTAVSVGLLFVLRRQPLAQQASWWSCLLLTLLTARWLTFQSMFVV